MVGMGGVPGGNDDDAGAKRGEEGGIGGIEPAVVIEYEGVNGAERLGKGRFEIMPGRCAVEVAARVVIERSVTDDDGGAEGRPVCGEEVSGFAGDAGPDAVVDGYGAHLEMAAVEGGDLVGAAGFEGGGAGPEGVAVSAEVGEHRAGEGRGGFAAIDVEQAGELIGGVVC